MISCLVSASLISPEIVAFVAPIVSAGCATEVWARGEGDTRMVMGHRGRLFFFSRLET